MSKWFSTSAMISTWSIIIFVTYVGLSISHTFVQFLLACFGVGITLGGFGAHKHAFTVELLGLKLQPDYIVIDNTLSIPIIFLVGTYGTKIGSLVGSSSPSFVLWICTGFCLVNVIIALYMHHIVTHRKKRDSIEKKPLS